MPALHRRFGPVLAAVGLLACSASDGTAREQSRAGSAGDSGTPDSSPLGSTGGSAMVPAGATTDPGCPVEPDKANGTACSDLELRCVYAPACGGAECRCELDEPEDAADAGTEDDAHGPAAPSAHFKCVHRAC